MAANPDGGHSPYPLAAPILEKSFRVSMPIGTKFTYTEGKQKYNGLVIGYEVISANQWTIRFVRPTQTASSYTGINITTI